MEPWDLLLPGVAVATSLVALALGARALALPLPAVGGAVTRALECLGLTLAFLAANAALGATVLWTLQRLGAAVTVHAVSDVTLVALSAFQAVVFRWWWAARD